MNENSNTNNKKFINNYSPELPIVDSDIDQENVFYSNFSEFNSKNKIKY